MVTRRDLLQLGGGALLGAGLLAGAQGAQGTGSAEARALDGDHEQAGILGRQPRHVAIASIDLGADLRGSDGRREVAALLQDWTAAGRLLMAGQPISPELGPQAELQAPADTGETAGLGAARLTLTFALGRGLLDPARGLIDPARSGWERGEAARGSVARETAEIAPMRGDRLDPRWSAGDLLVVAAADDPQVAAHAVRALLRLGRGSASLRSLQRGFLPSGEGTPRNLLGFKDGSGNPDAADPGTGERMLWVGSEGPAWLQGGGTYLVLRRIATDLSLWDATSADKQELTVGRERGSGAPLGSRGEFDEPELARTGADGAPLIDPRSHVALGRVAARAGQQILRRPWSYVDGADAVSADLDAGLLFLAFQRSVRGQFVPLQRTLADVDLLSEYIQAVGSAVYAVPPAPRGAGDWIGKALLA